MNRRAWLKNSAFLSGGLSLLSGGWNSLAASPLPPGFTPDEQSLITDATVGEGAPALLKARLFANENPFGPSEKAKQAIEAATNSSYQYPFMDIRALEDKITAYEGLGKDMVVVAAGSSPLLLAAAIHFGKDGGSIITGDPSYDDLPSRAKKIGANWVKVPLTADYKLDLDAMEKAIDSKTTLVYICNPNNPTATVLDAAKLKDFCERVSKKVTVFVDEAYIDYLPDPQSVTLMDGIKKGQNIIVARTFSKLYGFAGLRVGYVAAQPEMIKKLEAYGATNICVSAPSVSAALASYQDKVFLQDALAKTVTSKEFLYKTLKAEGYEYIPSSANFVMFPLKMDGQRFTQEMMKRGVGLRNWKFNNKDWCRISIGRMDEMEAFAAAFKELS